MGQHFAACKHESCEKHGRIAERCSLGHGKLSRARGRNFRRRKWCESRHEIAALQRDLAARQHGNALHVEGLGK